MTKDYKKENGNLVITIPLKQRRINVYEEMATGDGDVGEMDAIIGLYEDELNNGLCHRIDMDYSGKPDQYTDYFYKLDGTKEEFQEMVEELGIDAVYLDK